MYNREGMYSQGGQRLGHSGSLFGAASEMHYQLSDGFVTYCVSLLVLLAVLPAKSLLYLFVRVRAVLSFFLKSFQPTLTHSFFKSSVWAFMANGDIQSQAASIAVRACILHSFSFLWLLPFLFLPFYIFACPVNNG